MGLIISLLAPCQWETALLCYDISHGLGTSPESALMHDDVIKWKHFPRYWPFVLGIHRSPVNSLHKSQWHGPLMFSLICAWINSWVNNLEAGDLRHHRDHSDVTVMVYRIDCLVEDCCISSPLAMKIREYCIKPSILFCHVPFHLQSRSVTHINDTFPNKA